MALMLLCALVVAGVLLPVHASGDAAAAPQQSQGKKPPPNFIFILQDDLGHWDVEFTDGNQDVANVTGNISSLAKQGIVLTSHYVHWHCSPTRRSLISGRLPLHHSELLSGLTTDDLDLRWTWISEKLKTAGYTSYWFGKGHTGYKSMNHLPVRRGFDGNLMFLSGAGDYYTLPRWVQEEPICNNTEYSTDLFGNLTVQAIQQHDVSTPLFIYLPFQAVHSPYDRVPNWPSSSPVYHGMLYEADLWVGRIETLLKARGMWDNTLIVYSADNGGIGDGINYPLRGEKHTNWEGGMRAAAFVSGGFVPAELRGTQNEVICHIADWYATFSTLAGVDPSDDPPVPPLKPDPADPKKDLYGNSSYPPVDGVNLWPFLSNPQPYRANNTLRAAAHEYLWLSEEVLLNDQWKLVVAQPSINKMSANNVNNGWRQPNGTWVCKHGVPGNKGECPGDAQEYGCTAYTDRTHFRPCLFNVAADRAEHFNLADTQPDLLHQLWARLNLTQLTAFTSRSPAKLLGPCEPSCAAKRWSNGAECKRTPPGPICDVPQCRGDDHVTVPVAEF